jgi:hypothetical protein
MDVMLQKTRGAFLNLWTAKSVQGEGEPRFGGSFLLEPTHPGVKAMNQAIEAVAKEKWGAKAEAVLTELRKKDKVCMRNGDDKANYDGFEGNMYVAASSKTRPTVLDRDKSPLVEADGRPYGGCFVNAKARTSGRRTTSSASASTRP